jgi:hypothetical protein
MDAASPQVRVRRRRRSASKSELEGGGGGAYHCLTIIASPQVRVGRVQ